MNIYVIIKQMYRYIQKNYSEKTKKTGGLFYDSLHN